MKDKYSLKRKLLNVGLVLLIIGGLWRINVETTNNKNLTVVHGKVVEVTENHGVKVAYEVNGIKKTDEAYRMRSGPFKWSYSGVSGLEYMDEADFFYNYRLKKLSMPQPSDNSDSLLVCGIVLTVCCCGAFKGYKRYFIDRYPVAFFVTVFSELLVMTYAAGITYSNNYSGLYGLGDYLGGLFLAVAEQIFVIIMWTVAVKKYKKRCKSAPQRENTENGDTQL